jgi:hypothetical protein
MVQPSSSSEIKQDTNSGLLTNETSSVDYEGITKDFVELKNGLFKNDDKR